ncbi:MAG: hypothetical protein PHV13_01230 [Candidatus ainarchaeum sp.]|nr:hypothetical protein [Candidatus ainarchaeum sp.]
MVERAVPKPVRSGFRWMNFHFSEKGRAIYHFAKTLPPEQQKDVIELGKQLRVAEAKANFPRATRNVLTSLIVGQGMWYIVCPALSHIPHIRDTALGWLAWGGSDKLFISPEQLVSHTGGYSTSFAAQLADKAPKTVAFGGTMLAIELITDFSRCYIEYWTQKKYGIAADGCARAYGQVRPFFARYSSIEAYQKIIGYVLKPWTIGTPQQIFSSIQGFMGSLWRTGPQLAVVLTVGRVLDAFLGKISWLVGIRKIADRIIEDGRGREEAALQAIRKIVGDEKFTALKFQLAAISRSCWKWNPFTPVLAPEKAELAAKVVSAHAALEAELKTATDVGEIKGFWGLRLDLVSVFSRKGWYMRDGRLLRDLTHMDKVMASGSKALRKLPSFVEVERCEDRIGEDIRERKGVQKESLDAFSAAFGRLLTELQAERRLK